MKNTIAKKLFKTVNTLFTSLVCVLLLNTPGYAIETTTYYHHDGLGSTVAASDVEGNLLWREDYQPYGSRVRNPGSADNTLWFTGKPEEPSLGLQYFGARWYDPVAGRFTGIDPVGVREGNIHSFNRYGYANNNPYIYIDPDGKWAEDIFIGIPSMALGATNAFNNISDGNYGWAAVDVLGVVIDGFAIATPGVPGGAGFGITAGRQVSNVAVNSTKKALSGKNPPINKSRQKLHTDGTQGKSQFKEGVDADKLVEDAWQNGTPKFNKNGKIIGKVKQYKDKVGTEGQKSVDVRFSKEKGIHGFPSNKTE